MPKIRKLVTALLRGTPEKVNVTAISPVPLFYMGEDGVYRIPCIDTNPVRYGMPWGISATIGAYEEKSVLWEGNIDRPELIVREFEITLKECPVAQRGSYSGTISVAGGLGQIVVNLKKCSCVCR